MVAASHCCTCALLYICYCCAVALYLSCFIHTPFCDIASLREHKKEKHKDKERHKDKHKHKSDRGDREHKSERFERRRAKDGTNGVVLVAAAGVEGEEPLPPLPSKDKAPASSKPRDEGREGGREDTQKGGKVDVDIPRRNGARAAGNGGDASQRFEASPEKVHANGGGQAHE